MIEHQSVKNLIVGAIVIGLLNIWGDRDRYRGRFEVFNPFSQRVCEMPDLIGDEQIFGYSFFLFLNHKL